MEYNTLTVLYVGETVTKWNPVYLLNQKPVEFQRENKIQELR